MKSENDLPEGLQVEDCYIYPSPDAPSLFFYIPGEPIAETDANGEPTVNLWMSDQWATFQCGVRWELKSEQLEVLKSTIVDHYNLEIEAIRLAPAPVSIQQVCLQLHDPDGSLRDLKTEQSSDYPPYTALFNLQLSAADKGQVAAAIAGRENLLFISYKASLAIPTTLSVTLAGEVRTLLASLPKRPDLEVCRRQIIQAIDNQQLSLQYSSDNQVSQSLKQQAEQEVIDKAAILLHSMKNGKSQQESTIKVSIRLTENTQVLIERSTDMSTWFSSSIGQEHIQVFSV